MIKLSKRSAHILISSAIVFSLSLVVARLYQDAQKRQAMLDLQKLTEEKILKEKLTSQMDSTANLRYRIEHVKPQLEIATSPSSDSPISVGDQEIYDYMQKRWDFYERRDGEYVPERHDDLVLYETAKTFGISKDQAFKVFDKVEKIRLGLKPKEQIVLDSGNIPVNIRVVKVGYEGNELKVTLQNRTKKEMTLPTVRLTCYAISESSKEIGYNVIWVDDFGYQQTKTYSRVTTMPFKRVKIEGFMNIDKIRAAGLKSEIQASNDLGETIIPIFKTDIIDL